MAKGGPTHSTIYTVYENPWYQLYHIGQYWGRNVTGLYLDTLYLSLELSGVRNISDSCWMIFLSTGVGWWAKSYSIFRCLETHHLQGTSPFTGIKTTWKCYTCSSKKYDAFVLDLQAFLSTWGKNIFCKITLTAKFQIFSLTLREYCILYQNYHKYCPWSYHCAILKKRKNINVLWPHTKRLLP